MEECQRSIDSREFAEWKYLLARRILERPADERAALVAAEAHNSHPYIRRGKTAIDFMRLLGHRLDPPRQSPAAMLAEIDRAIANWPGEKKR